MMSDDRSRTRRFLVQHQIIDHAGGFIEELGRSPAAVTAALDLRRAVAR